MKRVSTMTSLMGREQASILYIETLTSPGAHIFIAIVWCHVDCCNVQSMLRWVQNTAIHSHLLTFLQTFSCFYLFRC